MKVLADLHHGDLYYSLHLLFEKRLGFELYHPIGTDWYEEGYWHIFNHPATVQQYLSLEQAARVEDDIYYILDATKENHYRRGVTLATFKDMKFDIILSSIPSHIKPFNKLIQLYQPQAKHIFQVGNAWGNPGEVQNILSSTAPFFVTPNINACFYHQEFDLDMFSYTAPQDNTSVGSYIHYMKGLDVLECYKKTLSDWLFTTCGASMDISFQQTRLLAEHIQSTGWVWHYKPEGDGYGHILHNAYACGRPTIINTNHYQGKLGSLLLEDKVTCVDISQRSVYDNAALLRQLANPEEHQAMCERAYKRFCDVVNFDEEEVKIRKFIQNLR